MKEYFSVFSATVYTLFCSIFGCWDLAMSGIMLFVIIDIITGIAKGYINSGLSSKRMFIGSLKKSLIMVVIALATYLDKLLNTDNMIIRNAVCVYYIAMEGLSILENLSMCGIHFPKFIKRVLEILRDENDNGGELNE